jgi:hypothetical protein
MNKLLKATLYGALFVGAAMFGQAADAAIIGNGSVSMAGGFSPTGGSGDMATATGIHFLPAGSGNVQVTSPGGTGSFAPLVTGTTGTITDFTFNPPSTPVMGFLTIGGFSFDLDSITVVSQNSTFLDLHGVATVTEAGVGSTEASFDFSGQGGGLPATFSWSATAAAAAVPEPMTLGVLGFGLAAFGFVRRRSEAKQV